LILIAIALTAVVLVGLVAMTVILFALAGKVRL
jgi:hypothetical protein